MGKHRKDLSDSFPDKGNIQLFLIWSVQFCSWASKFRKTRQLWCHMNKSWPARRDSCLLFHLCGDTVNNTSCLTFLMNFRHQSLNCNSGTLVNMPGQIPHQNGSVIYYWHYLYCLSCWDFSLNSSCQAVPDLDCFADFYWRWSQENETRVLITWLKFFHS